MNKASALVAAISKAIKGNGFQDELDAAILSIGGGSSVAVSDAKSRFQGAHWDLLKRHTSEMVALIQPFENSPFKGIALQGRVYLNVKEFKTTQAISFPLPAVNLSNWLPEEVVPNIAKELKVEVKDGAYFFGMNVRDQAVHFAIAATSNPDDLPEVYFVNSKGWHLLDTKIWSDQIMFDLGQAQEARMSVIGSTETEEAIGALCDANLAKQGNSFEEAGESSSLLDAKARALIMNFGAELLAESANLQYALKVDSSSRHDEALTKEWNVGYETSQLVLEVVEKKNRELEREIRNLKRTLSSSAHEKLANVPHSPPAKPLQERMGALLGL